MQGTGVGRRDGAVAWMLLLVLHALFGWMLTRIARIKPIPHADSALQVVYLQPSARDVRREHDELAIPPPASLSDATRSGRPPRVESAKPLAPVVARTGAVTATPRPGSLSAVFIEQARQSAASQARDASPPVDPFASRRTQLPGAGGGRFRMRRQRTPEDVVNAVASYLFAPKGYEQDPCPRNRANIDALITGGDSAALQDELAFERSHCRP